MTFMRVIMLFIALLTTANASPKKCGYAECILNVYAWSGEIPDQIIRQFETETGVTVNFSTYENNEIMFAKLRSVKQNHYDIIMPSSYFIQRMKKYNLLQPLDLNKLPNRRHLSTVFQKPDYDRDGAYSVPFVFGITGIFVNQKQIRTPITSWHDLWNPALKDKLMMLDDSREVFSMALLSLGYTASDTDPSHIKQAFLKLKQLMTNIKVFSTETIVSIMIDEDAQLGMTWNGDYLKASRENSNLQFIFPQEGYVMWVDNLAISKDAPHPDAAHAFINFLLRPDVAKIVALKTRFPITNESAKKLLPSEIQFNPVAYPDAKILKKAQFQIDPSEKTLELFERYWEELKISF